MKDYQEPEVVAIGRMSRGILMDVITPEENESFEGDYTIPLITLQSHREAVEPLRAALQACIDALGTCRVMAKDSEGNYTREVTPKIIVDALDKEKEALK